MSAPRFTLRGGPAVESRLDDITRRVADDLTRPLDARHWRALLLIGGYGRGEGGVETRADGTQTPHNNLDFLLITRGLNAADRDRLKRRLDGHLAPLAAEFGLGLDLGLVDELNLRTAPALVMWYDLRFGHRTLRGDADFVPGLTRFTAEAIVPADIRNLLVNRGALLLINDAILARGLHGIDDRRAIVRHAMKAIIGYGDALLFARGQYHWSYAEKQRRMRALADAVGPFARTYDQALEFRFAPDYAAWLARDLGGWMHTLRAELAPIHRETEAARLQRPDLAWESYYDIGLAAARTLDNPLSLRTWARAAKRLVRGEGAVSPRESLSLLFPLVAYESVGAAAREQARALLDAADTSPDALRTAYLQAWGAHGDTNFAAVDRKLNLGIGRAREAKAA